MTQKQAQRPERTTEQPAAPSGGKQQERDFSEIDALLDEIEEVLEDNDEKRTDFDYKAKLKSWAKAQGNMHTAQPCDDCVEQMAAQGLRPVGRWESTEGAMEIPCGCC